MLIQEQDWHTFKRVLIVKLEANSSVQVELGKDNDGTPLAYICALWVDPKYRRKGIGRELLHEAEKQCVERGCNRAILNWSKARGGTPYWTLEWYNRQGWQEVEFGKGYARLKKKL